MKPEAKEFLLAEYAELRHEILDALRQVPTNEKWALTISGVFWAWYASGEYPAVIVCIPVVLVVLLFFRWRAIENKFSTFGAYIKKVEERFDLEGLGWEHFIEGPSRHWFRPYGWVTWISLIIGNFALALWMIYKAP